MKKLLVLFTFFLNIHSVFPQNTAIDDSLKKIAAEKDDNKRIDIIINCTYYIEEVNPLSDIQFNQKLLLQSQKNDDQISEAMALSNIGYDCRSFGDNSKSLEYSLKGLSMAEKNGNMLLLATMDGNLELNYHDMGDYKKAISLGRAELEITSTLNYFLLQRVALSQLSSDYLTVNNLDSALFYSQRAYEITKKYGFFAGSTLELLGTIHRKMGDSALALSYLKMALSEYNQIKSPKKICGIYNDLAEYYFTMHEKDSSVVYAKKAINAVENSPFSNYRLKPAKLLADIYRKSNSDSTIKYLDMYMAAKDSSFNQRAVQQMQAMTLEDELQHQQMAEEKAKADEQQKENIQYALIALGIVTFIIFFLLLSRSFITNTKFIEFFGVMALLIVFEFLNLLLHPYLDKITNHTPLLMLLVLVCISALLIPMHHRLEKWATHRLVEKNKQIRLAAAKKTIEKLENNKAN